MSKITLPKMKIPMATCKFSKLSMKILIPDSKHCEAQY